MKVFNNIVAKSLLEMGAPPGSPGRVAFSVAGDPPEAGAVALRLLDELGFDQVDAGRLDESWRQQPGTPAYCRDLDVASLKRALAEGDRSRLAEYRRERSAAPTRGAVLGPARQKAEEIAQARPGLDVFRGESASVRSMRPTERGAGRALLSLPAPLAHHCNG